MPLPREAGLDDHDRAEGSAASVGALGLKPVPSHNFTSEPNNTHETKSPHHLQ